jgi:DNA-binding GntR family transcriptional regulator
MQRPAAGSERLPFGPSRRGLLREDVYRYLRDEIVRGRLEPGQRLRDADIAAELEVSRTPVREALRRLEDEGLVETWANRWTRVATIDIGEADRIYPIVWALERLAVLAADAFSEARMQALRDANDMLRDALAEHDAVTASDADREFHRLLLDAWGNPDAMRILVDLQFRLQRIEIHYFSGGLTGEKSVDEHQAIIDALAAGDREAAARALEQNWRNSLARLHGRAAFGIDAAPER